MPKSETKTGQGKGQQPSIVAIIPAHNEERFIGSVVLRVRRHVDTVIVVDDGSTDGTAEIAEAAGAVVLRHETNLGKGAALRSGFERARATSAQAVIVLDGDGQHLADEIPTVAGPVLDGQADMVVGSRFLHSRCDVPQVRGLGLRAVTWLSNIGSGMRLSDSQTGFRAFSREAMDQLSLRADGFSVESEMQFRAQQLGLRTQEVSISSRYQDAPKRNVLVQGLEVLDGVLRLIGQHRPLLFFGLPGTGALLSGLWWGWRVVDIYRTAQQLAVGYALVALLLVIVGSVILSTGLILHSLRGLLLELLGPGRA